MLWRRGGLIVGALSFAMSSLGSSPAGDAAFYSWPRHVTLTVSFSTQVYKYIIGNYNFTVLAFRASDSQDPLARKDDYPPLNKIPAVIRQSSFFFR